MDQLAKENAALKQQVQAMVLKLKQAEQMNGGESICLAMGMGFNSCLLSQRPLIKLMKHT